MALKLDEQFDGNGNLLDGYAANQSIQTQVSIPETGNRYSDVSDDTDFQIAEKKIKVGKKYFGDDRTIGLIQGIDERDGKVKFEMGSSPSKMLKIGDDLEMKGGNISGGSLNIPNPTSPLASIDNIGNMVVSSLRRKDFHWYTIFESVDGYDMSADTGGSSLVNLEGIELITPATNTKKANASKQSTHFKGFDWSKKRSIKICLTAENSFTNNEIMEFGALGSNFSTCIGIGFRKVNGSEHIHGICGDGSSESTVDLGHMDYSNNSNNYSIDFDPITGCKFYINDVYKGAITTNLPTGTITAGYIFIVNLKTLENTLKKCLISYYDFWQAL